MEVTRAPNRGSSGFALIVTLALMILLAVVAVGLLNLSTSTLRFIGRRKNQTIELSCAFFAARQPYPCR